MFFFPEKRLNFLFVIYQNSFFLFGMMIRQNSLGFFCVWRIGLFTQCVTRLLSRQRLERMSFKILSWLREFHWSHRKGGKVFAVVTHHPNALIKSYQWNLLKDFFMKLEVSASNFSADIRWRTKRDWKR